MLDERRKRELKGEHMAAMHRIEDELKRMYNYVTELSNARSDSMVRDANRNLNYRCKNIIGECLDLIRP